MKQLLRTMCVLLCTVFFVGARQAPAQPTLTVLAAASLREVMADVVPAFEKARGVRVELVLGASGQLAQQITAGAPGDVFVSASSDVMEGLVKEELIDVASRMVVARNVLVLVVPADGKGAKITRFEDLGQARRVAIGEPGSVPAGAYARQVLGHLKLEVGLADKLVFGANVRQVADYVARGEVDAGIVYATDAAAVPGLKVVATADPSWHEPIEYHAAMVKTAEDAALSRSFVSSLMGEAARSAFAKRGFKVRGATTLPATVPATVPSAR